MESLLVVKKIRELYSSLESEGIGVAALRCEDRWLVFFSKEGHEEAFSLPGDFVASCVEQGYCNLFREEMTQALGRLMEAVSTHTISAALVVSKIKELVPGLADPGIIIAVSEDEPAWSFFMTRRGMNRPVEYKLPAEVIERCLEKGDCRELRKASRIAFQCLVGE